MRPFGIIRLNRVKNYCIQILKGLSSAFGSYRQLEFIVGLIERYRNERRLLEIQNFIREDLKTVIRYTPKGQHAEGVICFAQIDSQFLDDEIQSQIAYFDARNIGFEWKVYNSDKPAYLKDRLIELGFTKGEPESLMVYEVDMVDGVGKFRAGEFKRNDQIICRRVMQEDALKQLVLFQEDIWDKPFPWLFDQLCSMLGNTSIFAAYEGELLIGTGWIEYPNASQFAELHGGAVHRSFRERGIYSQLFELRVRDAIEKGVKWIAVDASPMSCPILEAKGFLKLDTSHPMTWSRNIEPAKNFKIAKP